MALDIEDALQKGRTVYKPNTDGSVTFTQPNGETWTVDNPAATARATELEATRGQSIIARARGKRGSLIEKHTIAGEDYFLLRMDDTNRNLVAECTARWGDGSLRLDRPEVQSAFKRAVLQVGLVQGERDVTPLFDPDLKMLTDAFGEPALSTEIEEFCREPEAPVVELFGLLTDLNPQLFPEKKIIEEIGMKVARGEI